MEESSGPLRSLGKGRNNVVALGLTARSGHLMRYDNDFVSYWFLSLQDVFIKARLMEVIVTKDQKAFANTKPGESELAGLRACITTIRRYYSHALQTRETVRDLYGNLAEALRLCTHDDPPDYNMPQFFYRFPRDTHTGRPCPMGNHSFPTRTRPRR